MKVIIYTANIGNYDNDIQMNNLEYPFYRINISNSKNPRLLAREIKLNPHKYLPEHDYSIWIDSNIEIVSPKFEFNYDIVTWKHPERDCIYDEGMACIRLKKEEPEIVFDVLHRYRIENYPNHNGLLCSAYLIRKNTEEVRNFCCEWWDEVKNNSIRDQLSFNFVIKKYNLNILYQTAYEGFRKIPHKKNR